MVLDAPLFQKKIQVTEGGPRVGGDGNFIFYDLTDYRLADKWFYRISMSFCLLYKSE